MASDTQRAAFAEMQATRESARDGAYRTFGRAGDTAANIGRVGKQLARIGARKAPIVRKLGPQAKLDTYVESARAEWDMWQRDMRAANFAGMRRVNAAGPYDAR